MDTSVTYIQMCKAATEVQQVEAEYDQQPAIIPNLYVRYCNTEEKGHDQQSISKGYFTNPDEAIWLPRIDQIYNIWTKNAATKLEKESNKNTAATFIKSLSAEVTPFLTEREYNSSFEQFALRTLMYDVYDKSWDFDNNVWVKINSFNS